jgi:hypothetical protein
MELFKQVPNKNLITILEELLEQAQQGELIGFTSCCEYRGENYSIIGSNVDSRLRHIGMLFEAAVARARD